MSVAGGASAEPSAFLCMPPRPFSGSLGGLEEPPPPHDQISFLVTTATARQQAAQGVSGSELSA